MIHDTLTYYDLLEIKKEEGIEQGIEQGIDIEGDIDSFTQMIWNHLNEENKVSLFVRYIDIETGGYETRIVNKN